MMPSLASLSLNSIALTVTGSVFRLSMRSVTRKRCGEEDGSAATVSTVMRGGTIGGFLAAIAGWLRQKTREHAHCHQTPHVTLRPRDARAPMMRQSPPSFTDPSPGLAPTVRRPVRCHRRILVRVPEPKHDAVPHHGERWRVYTSLLAFGRSILMRNQPARRVAIIGGVRIPFCRAHTAYARASNQDMMTAVLQGLVKRYGLEGQTLGDVSLGAVIKHSRDYNLARESTLSSGLAPQTPAFDVQRACGTSLTATILIATKISTGLIDVRHRGRHRHHQRHPDRVHGSLPPAAASRARAAAR